MTDLAFSEAGSVDSDFLAQVLAVRALLEGATGAVLLALIVGATTDPALRKAIASKWVAPRKRWGLARLARAREDGELRPHVDPEVALDLFYSPLYARLLLGLGVPRSCMCAPTSGSPRCFFRSYMRDPDGCP